MGAEWSGAWPGQLADARFPPLATLLQQLYCTAVHTAAAFTAADLTPPASILDLF